MTKCKYDNCDLTILQNQKFCLEHKYLLCYTCGQQAIRKCNCGSNTRELCRYCSCCRCEDLFEYED